MLFSGKSWVFGDNIDTDIIMPGRYLFSPPEEAAQHAFEAIKPTFSKMVKKGDIIVAGKHFGCGSGREIAPLALKYLGIVCFVAESFSRSFFRNCIANGIPALSSEKISKKIMPGEEITVDIEKGEIVINKSGEKIKAMPLHAKMLEVIKSGGIEAMLIALKRKNNE